MLRQPYEYSEHHAARLKQAERIADVIAIATALAAGIAAYIHWLA